MSVSTLYLCYFGLREPLVQTQVLPYLRQLVRGGARVHLLTFEPELRARWTAEEVEAERARLSQAAVSAGHALRRAGGRARGGRAAAARRGERRPRARPRRGLDGRAR